jgi:hypothetical protein
MAPLFTNNSCAFYTPESSPCQLGNYARYAIAAEEVADIAAGISFASARNLRLTIKNTGHEYVIIPIRGQNRS